MQIHCSVPCVHDLPQWHQRLNATIRSASAATVALSSDRTGREHLICPSALALGIGCEHLQRSG
eukprot:4712896-Prymnesium_polylepis.1